MPATQHPPLEYPFVDATASHFDKKAIAPNNWLSLVLAKSGKVASQPPSSYYRPGDSGVVRNSRRPDYKRLGPKTRPPHLGRSESGSASRAPFTRRPGQAGVIVRHDLTSVKKFGLFAHRRPFLSTQAERDAIGGWHCRTGREARRSAEKAIVEGGGLRLQRAHRDVGALPDRITCAAQRL